MNLQDSGCMSRTEYELGEDYPEVKVKNLLVASVKQPECDIISIMENWISS